MRDPKRIGEILQLMGLLWVQPGYVDMRATQMLMNAARAGGWSHRTEKCICNKQYEVIVQDPWYVEDDVIIEGLKTMLRKEGVPV